MNPSNPTMPSMPFLYVHRATPTMHREPSVNHRDSEIVSRPVVSRKAPKHVADPDKVIKKTTGRRPMLALLIAGYNEELVIGNTIRSAINAGMEPSDIYVVDDNSNDQTSAIASSILGPNNVLKVDRSGKGLALTKGAKHFDLTRRYRWIHIADADGGFSPDYFKIFRSRLRVKYVAATGYVRSLPGGPISQYRVLEYTIGQEIHRRFQALTHTVTVIPGPTSCFRSDIFRQVNFANKSLTEDFDVTLQIHRRKLGKIQFIPQAIAYTQDPSTLKDYTKQITRWNRGVMQGIQRHGVGKHFNRLDAYLSYQVAQNLLFFAGYCVYVPYEAFARHSPDVIALTFLYDVIITFATTVIVAMKARRPDILSAFPHIYAFRWISTFVFLRAFAEVVFLRRFRVTEGFWSPPTRTKNPTSA